MYTKAPKNAYSDVEFEETPFFETDVYNVYRSKISNPMEKIIEREKLKMARSAAGYIQRPQSQGGDKQSFNNRYNSNHIQIQQFSSDTKKSVQFRPATSKPNGNSKYETSYTAHSSKVKKSAETVSKFGVPHKPSDIPSLKNMLYFDQRTNSIPKTTIKNKIVENLLKEGRIILQKDSLMENMYKLKNQNLLKNYKANVKSQKGIGKLDFIPNDVHSKATNPGYKRNALGTFYYR